MTDDINHLRQWVGKREVTEETLSAAPALRLLATLDDDRTRLRAGDALPPLWHWLYFHHHAHTREIGTDGHARRGGFLPPTTLPRRMFAGAKLTFHAPLVIGATAQRQREVVSVEQKAGREGPLLFVGVHERIEQNGQVCIEERQTIVYRGPGAARPAPAVTTDWPPSPQGAWVRTVLPSVALLFRFSALTFNAHRIHYDRTYAMSEEGYPGLVVHGTLLALLLIELVRCNDCRAVTHFSFRAQAPLFDVASFRLVGHATAQRVALTAEGPGGVRATEAEAILAAR